MPAEDPDVDRAPVLSPDELDIREDERVVQLEDGRYVIWPGADRGATSGRDDSNAIEGAGAAAGTPTDDPPTDDAETDPSAVDPPVNEAPATERGPAADPALRDLHARLAAAVGAVDVRYGFDVTAALGGEPRQTALFTNDVAVAFEHLVTWFAAGVGDDTPVEQALGILLAELDGSVRYPAASLRDYLDANDLDPDDSIADLLAVADASGFRFPR